MNIDQAIEILSDLGWNKDTLDEPDTQAALQLGSEALLEVKRAREGDPALDGELLPGETEE